MRGRIVVDMSDYGLSGRQRDILHKTLEMYISSGAPVGSAVLADEVGVSSSTVRADLAVLERRGLLWHPHTSAGRVPTDAGYRYYVNALINEGTAETGVGFRELEGCGNLDELLKGISEGMSEVSRLLAVVAGPGVFGDEILRVDHLPLGERELLLVVSMRSGISSSARITLPVAIEGEEMAEMISSLNSWFAEGDVRFSGGLARAGRGVLSGYSPQAVVAVLEAVEALSRSAERGVFVQGASALLSRLDALDPVSFAVVLEVFERRRWLLSLLEDALQRSSSGCGVVVSIGEESGFRSLAGTSLVAAAYERRERPYGVVSLIGPKRMDYEQAIFTVRSAADTITQCLNSRF